MASLRLLHGAINGSVLIDGDCIARVGDISTFDVPDDTQTIDCAGATILPGFWNTHVHFFERKWSDASSIPAPELAAQLEDFTGFGFTSVFDLSSAWSNTRALRERIQSGEIPGPNVYSVGEGLVQPGVMPSATVMAVMGIAPAQMPEIADAEAARKATRALLDAGVDAIKVFLSSNSGQIVLPLDVLRAIVDEVHGARKKVFVHPNTPDDVRTALRAGVDVLAHTTPRGAWDDEILQAARDRRTALVPTLALWKQLMQHDRISVRDTTVATAIEQLRAWRDAGGIVLFGTDYGVVGADPSDEYALMREAGMSDNEIVASMTSVPAEFFGDADRGRIAEGCIADLVIADAPLGPVRTTLRSGGIVHTASP